MPNIQPFYSRRRPTAEVGAKRVSPYEIHQMTAATRGMAELGGAIAGIGGIAQDFLQKLDKAERDTQYSTARREGRERYLQLDAVFSKEQDPANYQTHFDKALKDIQRLAPRHKEAAQDFKLWLDDRTPMWQGTVNRMKHQRQISILDVDSTINLQRAKETGDRIGAVQSIKDRVDNLLWTKLQGEEATRTLDSEIDYFKAANMIRSMAPVADIEDASLLRDISDITPDEILEEMDFDQFKNLTPEYKDLLMKDAKTIASDRGKAATEKLSLIQGQTDIDFFGKYRVDLTPSDIKLAVARHRLTVSAGDRWLDRLATPRDFPTDPNTEARILKELADPESKITTSDVLDLIGKPDGLSTDDARRFIADMDFFKDEWFQRADQYLKQNLGWSDAFVKFAHPEGALAYSLAMNKLFSAIETEKLKDKDIYKRAEEIARPYLIDYWIKGAYLSPEKVTRLIRMLEIKPPGAKPSEVKPEAPVIRALTPKERATRKGRIRRWVVPFNKKYNVRLQPSVLDAMSDEIIDWLSSLNEVEREAELLKMVSGKTTPARKTTPVGPLREKPKKGTGRDPMNIWGLD